MTKNKTLLVNLGIAQHCFKWGFMNDIVVDTETNGINPYYNCVIEAYFHIDDKNNYHLKARPDFWDDQAALIHNISYAEAMSYHDKKTAWRNFLKWLPKNFRFVNWANKNTELGCVNFDHAIIWNELNLLGMPQYHLENHYKMKPSYSVYDLAKYCAKNGYFTPIRGKSGRQSFTQENVYKALFGEKYNAHNAKDDVLALVRIYNELLRLNNEQRGLLWQSQ